MKKININISNIYKFNILLVVIAFLITMAVVYGGAYVQEGYTLHIGGVSPQRFKTPREIENTVKTEVNRQKAIEEASKVEPVMERDTAVKDDVLQSIEKFFGEVEKVRKEYGGNIQANSLAGEQIVAKFDMDFYQSKLPIYLNDFHINLLMDMSDKDFENFKSHITDFITSILDEGIQQLDIKTLLDISEKIENIYSSSEKNKDITDLGYEIVTRLIKPNIVENTQATQKTKNEISNNYDTQYYRKGQTIVDEGQIIDEEAYAALDYLSIIKEDDNRTNYVLIIGSFIVILSIFFLTISYLCTLGNKHLKAEKETSLLFTLYISTILISWMTKSFTYVTAPVLLFTMLVAMFFSVRISIVLNMSVSIICLLIYNGNLEYLIYFQLTGLFISLVAKFTADRNKIIFAGLITSVVSFVIYTGLTLFFEKGFTQTTVINAVYAGIIGIFTIIIAIGTAPFWEGVFGAITPFRLIDLTNPNSFLLRKLIIEAPGTYHHSLIVANLAETAAFEIGANPNLARAGGCFHDIGKLKHPQYYSENQHGENAHDTMNPMKSAQVIIEHVTYGMELATKNRIPKVIRDIIESHHGNSLIKFFYYKAKENVPFESINEKDFRYPYDPPKTKEGALVMLADTVEAAVRSIIPSGKTILEIEAIIRKLIKDKLEDGQLINSGLTIKDIEVTIQAFIRVFKGMYHERIPYPQDKQK